MNADDLRSRVTALSRWRRAGEQAPHKPLLLLLALADLHNEGRRWLPYSEAEGRLRSLLTEFGPHRAQAAANYPFWRLQTDGFWTVRDPDRFTRNSSGDVSAGQLRAAGAEAGFSDNVYRLLKTQPGLLGDLVGRILDAHFPESLHEDIRQALGLDTLYETPALQPQASRRARDPRFRELVLRAYGYQCTVCGFQLRLGDALVGLDAAHIQWHQAGGPAIVQNGLALCALHHKLFDRGVFTVLDGLTVLVSELANGAAALEIHLTPYQGRGLKGLVNREYAPAGEYLAWHRAQVFQGPASQHL
jgi:putative restriction endonuclease